MQTFNQLFFKKKQIFSYFFKEISDNILERIVSMLCVASLNTNFSLLWKYLVMKYAPAI